MTATTVSTKRFADHDEDSTKIMRIILNSGLSFVGQAETRAYVDLALPRESISRLLTLLIVFPHALKHVPTQQVWNFPIGSDPRGLPALGQPFELCPRKSGNEGNELA